MEVIKLSEISLECGNIASKLTEYERSLTSHIEMEATKGA